MSVLPLGDYDCNNDRKHPPPSAGVFDAPNVTVSINRLWVPHIAGLLYELTDENVWLGTDAERENAVSEVQKLLALLGAPNPTGETPVAEIGEIRAFILQQPPSGWLAFGQTVSGIDYPDLFNVAPNHWKTGNDILLPNLFSRLLAGGGPNVVGRNAFIIQEDDADLSVQSTTGPAGAIPMMRVNFFIYAGV